MKCIFCKIDSASSRSVEHVMPESFGNKDHILPPGWVCDACNNYLSIKVEAPFLTSWWGRTVRFGMSVESKKGKIPVGKAVHLRTRTHLDIVRGNKGAIIGPAADQDAAPWVQYLAENIHGTIYSPIADLPPTDYDTSRFIAKVSVEVLALRMAHIPGANQELVNQAALDPIRNYVRRGKPGFVWPLRMRRIYPGNFTFVDQSSEYFEVLHEWDVLPVSSNGVEGVELFVVVALFGVEFVINLGGPDLTSYDRWLLENNNASYLYSRVPGDINSIGAFLKKECPPML